MPPIDKIAHALAGAAIAGLAVAYGAAPILGFAAAFVAGIVKEVYDATGRGTVEWRDAAATILGGAAVLPAALPLWSV